jgi:peroxiredoxin
MKASLVVVTALAIVSASAGCAHPRVLDAVVPRVALPGTDGVAHELGRGASGAALTVLVFFAQHCPCQAAHDARLLEVARGYHDRGVDVFAVDPEPGATPERDATEALRRGYPFPILVDHGGALARRLGAEYATETFVVDRQGVVRFHGGIDSDRSALHDDARPYLRDALDDLLLGHAPRLAEAKAFGCALQLW